MPMNDVDRLRAHTPRVDAGERRLRSRYDHIEMIMEAL
jgi:hypothetical protein